MYDSICNNKILLRHKHILTIHTVIIKILIDFDELIWKQVSQ